MVVWRDQSQVIGALALCALCVCGTSVQCELWALCGEGGRGGRVLVGVVSELRGYLEPSCEACTCGSGLVAGERGQCGTAAHALCGRVRPWERVHACMRCAAHRGSGRYVEWAWRAVTVGSRGFRGCRGRVYLAV